jgi:hypothetical protein
MLHRPRQQTISRLSKPFPKHRCLAGTVLRACTIPGGLPDITADSAAEYFSLSSKFCPGLNSHPVERGASSRPGVFHRRKTPMKTKQRVIRWGERNFNAERVLSGIEVFSSSSTVLFHFQRLLQSPSPTHPRPSDSVLRSSVARWLKNTLIDQPESVSLESK